MTSRFEELSNLLGTFVTAARRVRSELSRDNPPFATDFDFEGRQTSTAAETHSSSSTDSERGEDAEVRRTSSFKERTVVTVRVDMNSTSNVRAQPPEKSNVPERPSNHRRRSY